MNVIIASMEENYGFGKFELTLDGKLKLKKIVQMPAQMYACQNNDRLYFALREPFGEAKSGVVSIGLNVEKPENDMTCCNGLIACHVSVSSDRKKLYTANYRSGEVSEFDLGEKGNIIALKKVVALPVSEGAPHAHGVFITPNGKELCVPDLGNDKVYFYSLTAEGIGKINHCVQFPIGSAPRHVAFNQKKDITYVVAQNSCEVFALNKSNKIISSISTGATQGSQASAIRISLDNKNLYVSNRGANTISIINIEEEQMKLIGQVPCGLNPRDFIISADGKWLVLGNMDDDMVFVYSVNLKNGDLTYCSNYKFKKPISILFTK